MMYLIWGILNLVLFIYFIIVCLKSIKLVKEKIGLFAVVIFILGLISFSGGHVKDSYRKNTHSSKKNKWEFVSKDSLKPGANFIVDLEIENNLVSKRHLTIIYGQDINGHLNIPKSASSSRTGLISGILWEPTHIIVKRTDNNTKFQYYVSGNVEWSLLGIRVYVQNESYEGLVSL